jgi:EmrB/QacA subfamily drug resistance transporter
MIKSTQKQVETPDNAYANKYIVLAIVLTGILMSVLDGFMVNIALPGITTHFNVSVAQSQWIITGYLLAMTGLFIFFAKISEYTGKTRLYIAGFTIFTLSSLACGLATTADHLIAFRIAQGIGASMVAGISGAITFEAFPPQERGRAMGYIAATYGIVALIAPSLGGFIVDGFGWQYIFFVNVPIGIILIACAIKYLKIREVTSGSLAVDWAGTATLIAAVVSLMLLCSEMANGLAITAASIAWGAIFVLSLIGFLYRESRCAAPLLDLSLFNNKKFILPVLSMALSYMAIIIMGVLGPFYLEGALGYNATQVGLLFMLSPLAMIFAAPAGGWLYDRFHWKYTTAAGMLILVVAYLAGGLAFMAMDIGFIIVAFVLRGIGDGVFQSTNSAEIMNAVPPEKIAIASSVTSTAGSLANSLGAVMASVLLIVGLGMAGYDGAVLMAGPPLLAHTIGIIMLMAGGLCIIAAVLSALRSV